MIGQITTEANPLSILYTLMSADYNPRFIAGATQYNTVYTLTLYVL